VLASSTTIASSSSAKRKYKPRQIENKPTIQNTSRFSGAQSASSEPDVRERRAILHPASETSGEETSKGLRLFHPFA